MYCLEKLQRELAYFFDMDLRELPRVQDLLAAQGYTQVQKGDEIIKLEPSVETQLQAPAHNLYTLKERAKASLAPLDKLYKPQSKQTPQTLIESTPPKPPPEKPSSRADEIGAAIHTDTPKVESSVATPKQKTIEKIESYANTQEFKALSKDKQEAILSLKTIEPSPMPQEISQENLENLFKHFNSKQDKTQREFYAKLFNDTKENPHITLEVKRDNEIRQEYIKAYQHKDTHDLYYIAITKDNDTIKVTGYPITKIKDVINQIKNAEKVVWRHQGDLTHTALDSKKSPNLESAENIIPQITTTLSKQAQDHAHQILQGLRKTAQTPLNKLADEVRSTDRGFMLREARYIKQRAQKLADNFANLRWQDLRAAMNYAKTPYNEAMFKELKAGIESKEFAKFIESSYPPKPTQKSLDEVESSDIIFTDKKGKEHTITQEVKQQWLDTFNLKSLDEAYTPKLPQDLQEAIGKEIKLTKGSLYKIVEKGREQYIPQIKETLEKPQIVIQDESELIFAKQIKDDLYLTSIGKDFDTHITIISNSPKTDKTIQNKLKNGKVIYEAKNAEALPTSGAFTETNQVPISSTIIPQQKLHNDEKKTLQGFEQAIAGKDTHTKIQIAKEHLEYLLTPLKEQKDKLKELIKNKNFDDDEIAEALQRIETTAKPHAKKRGNIFVPFVDKPSTGWLISDKLSPIEQAKTLIAYELERENKRFFTKVSNLGAVIRFLDRFKEALQEGSAQKWHFRDFDETLDSIAKELKKQNLAEKDAKSYDMTYAQARDLFYKGNPTQIQAELFEKVIPIAQKLGVNIRSAVRFRYENAGSDFTKNIAGMYRTNPNAATLKKGISQEIKHEVLLHELIHSVTSRAIYAYDRKQLDLLTTPQQNAIKNIKEIYTELFSKRDELGLKRWQDKENTGNYGLKNEHEMLAELANPSFVEKLKNIGIFEKLVDNIIKIIVSAKEIFGLKKTNAYVRLKDELENIIANYKDDFSTQWEAQKFRDRAMGSEKVDSSDIIFTDKKGKEHTLTQEVQEQWLETFNLKSLDESYTPKFSDEILQTLGGKEIKLQLGSLKKLVAQGREQYIPQIKEVLDSPEAIMRDNMGEYLFIKHLKDDDYFVNVSFDNGEYLISISNGIKETRNLNNKLEKGGKFIYQSPNFNSISQKLLQTSQYSANKIDTNIIPQAKPQMYNTFNQSLKDAYDFFKPQRK